MRFKVDQQKSPARKLEKGEALCLQFVSGKDLEMNQAVMTLAEESNITVAALVRQMILHCLEEA